MTTTADAYQAELYLGDILRYLKCCKITPDGSIPQPRYPNLKQVFISSRTYGGYANATTNGNTCLNPEPFAFELGFTVQRVVVAQINQDANITNNDQYSGLLDYKSDGTGHAPWFDWGPYLWAYGEKQRQFDGLNWCNGQNDNLCQQENDVLYGDPNDQIDYWGDFTHPAGSGVKKVANLLVNFIQTSPWITPWIHF